MVTFWEFSSCIENELIGKQNWLNNDFPFVFVNYGETNLNKIGVWKSHACLSFPAELQTYTAFMDLKNKNFQRKVWQKWKLVEINYFAGWTYHVLITNN